MILKKYLIRCKDCNEIIRGKTKNAKYCWNCSADRYEKIGNTATAKSHRRLANRYLIPLGFKVKETRRIKGVKFQLKIIKILKKFLLNNPNTKTQIKRELGFSSNAIHKYIENLKDVGEIKKDRMINPIKGKGLLPTLTVYSTQEIPQENKFLVVESEQGLTSLLPCSKSKIFNSCSN